ncbi:MAG: aryl-sulfate sulfotransferase [Bryobacteraceae bacterium]
MKSFAKFVVFVSAFSGIASAMTVTLEAESPPPALVGDVVTWNASTPDANSSAMEYRFRVRATGSVFRVIRDFSPSRRFAWTATDHDGVYQIQVTAKNTDSGETDSTTVTHEFTSRATGGSPVISGTANPLVALYSAPACPAGSRMRVQFQAPGGAAQNTDSRPCADGLSMNFYLGGVLSNTTYAVHHTTFTGTTAADGPTLSWTTPVVSPSIAGYSVLQTPQTTLPDGVLLQSTLQEMTVATDLQGNLIWYYPGNITSLTRPESGGLFLGIAENQGAKASDQVLREFDLAGNTTLETNAARINEQLAAMGHRQITSFHHEARRLPNGRIMTLAASEEVMINVQGPGAVDIIGDIILVLDRDLQVVWVWDSFDNLSLRRLATLGDTCQQATGGCPPFSLMQKANDWLHGNSLQLTPDGNILYSSRSQDWLLKIEYGNGNGTGRVMWRLGKDGDFQMNSDDPSPWFSHQHDPSLYSDSTLSVFDDGNTRQASDPSAHSCGQVLQLDEINMQARLVVNADLGAYSYALGSAQRLPNGDYHFDVGWIRGDGLGDRSQSVEVDRTGKIVYNIQAMTPEYRSFRMRDLYTAP